MLLDRQLHQRDVIQTAEIIRKYDKNASTLEKKKT